MVLRWFIIDRNKDEYFSVFMTPVVIRYFQKQGADLHKWFNFIFKFLKMESSVLILSLFLISCMAYSEASVKLEDLSRHAGDSVTVCGKVFSARYLSSSKNTPTFLNLGAAYPNQLLTVVIWGDVRKQFEGKPEELYNEKERGVSGRVELYKDKPQIVMHDSRQIYLKK